MGTIAKFTVNANFELVLGVARYCYAVESIRVTHGVIVFWEIDEEYYKV